LCIGWLITFSNTFEIGEIDRIIQTHTRSSFSSSGQRRRRPVSTTSRTYKGRPPSIDVTKVRDLKKKGLGASEIAKALKIGRASVYRALEA
jgi:DNA invertase Pin-like site-specific DNA recombinase